MLAQRSPVGLWEPEILNFALTELRREFSVTPAEKIVRAVDLAARGVRPETGRARLLQKAREALREPPARRPR